MSEKCFMCERDVDGQLLRTTLPKELIGKDTDGNLFDDNQPICSMCDDFKRAVDLNFINLCNDARLFEMYRADSKKRSDFFPSELIYNVDIEVLRELYYHILDTCEKAYKVASDDKHRQELRDGLNYAWRKKDE